MPQNTNLGPGFIKIKRTGNPDVDYNPTKSGKSIKHSDDPNVYIKISRWKYYFFTNQNISRGDEITLDFRKLPWKEFKEYFIMKTTKGCLNHILEQKVKIPIEKGDLGLSLDDSIEKYKDQIKGGKKWEETSQQLNTLEIFNKNKHPDVSKKASDLRDKLSKWIDKERKSNPEFGK